MNTVILAIGTLFSVFFAAMLFKGSSSDYMIEPLDDDAFPLKFFYSAGFAAQEIKIFRLRGKLGSKLREDTTLYYGKKFSEFYARAIWAQTLSFALLSISLLFLVAGLFEGDTCVFFALVGVVAAALAVYYFLGYTANKLKTRREECEIELPNAISKMALLVNSGATMHDAWKIVAYGKEGTFYGLMQNACEAMDNGQTEIEAIYGFGVASNSQNVKKFVTALIQSIERGGGELSSFLANQSSELWGQNRQRLLQKGEQAASALLMPIALMFAGVMLIVLASALQSFGF